MSRHSKELRSRQWERTRREVFARDGWRCTECGSAGRLECHHVTPLENGGAPYDPANLATMCRSCHVRLHRKPVSPELAAWLDRITILFDEKECV